MSEQLEKKLKLIEALADGLVQAVDTFSFEFNAQVSTEDKMDNTIDALARTLVEEVQTLREKFDALTSTRVVQPVPEPSTSWFIRSKADRLDI